MTAPAPGKGGWLSRFGYAVLFALQFRDVYQGTARTTISQREYVAAKKRRQRARASRKANR